MTKEEIKVYFPYLKALAEDKEIQCDISGEWKDIEEISFSIGAEHYRIKPKSEYKPFKNKAECWNEMLKHQPFGWVIDNKGDYLCLLSISERFKENDFSYMFNAYTFIDGKAFGVKL